jgi:hypothetical protein
LIQLAGWLGVIGTLVAIYNAVQSWRAPQWWGTRLWSTLIALACLGAVAFTFTWHLLQLTLKY